MFERLRLGIALPTILLLVVIVIATFLMPTTFVNILSQAQAWVLEYFDWLFDWTVFAMLISCLLVYISPLGGKMIGGEDAQPLLSKQKWFAIVLCTTIATGLLFWGCAEPLYHLHEAPYGAGYSAHEVSSTAVLFMHWSWSPYAIYTLISLLFALLYYNQSGAYSVSSFIGAERSMAGYGIHYKLLDIICLMSLISGMAASLGAGILTISGGIHQLAGVSERPLLWGVIVLCIAGAFIISSISGLQKGISRLSHLNTWLFVIFIICFCIGLGSFSLLGLAGQGAVEYIATFIPRSLASGGAAESWRHAWTTFYWANWMAWAPVTALFLGRLGRGYTVRTFIQVNLVYTSLFAMMWIIIFGGIALIRDVELGGSIYQLLLDEGPQSVIYFLLDELGYSSVGTLSLLLIVFISYVTSADSNTTAMSAMCTKKISPDAPEAPLGIKLICGLSIALIAWVMISYAGIYGIRILSVLGGFPVLFLCIWVVISMMTQVYRYRA